MRFKFLVKIQKDTKDSEEKNFKKQKKTIETDADTEKKFKTIKDIVEEYKNINLQYHEILELIRYFENNIEKKRMRDRFKFLINKIKITKILD